MCIVSTASTCRKCPCGMSTAKPCRLSGTEGTRDADLRIVAARASQCLPNTRGSSDRRDTGRNAAAIETAVAGSIRARCGAPLHEPFAAQFFDRHAFLPARVVHDEIQPARL